MMMRVMFSMIKSIKSGAVVWAGKIMDKVCRLILTKEKNP
jgi:hypothetical protein